MEQDEKNKQKQQDENKESEAPSLKERIEHLKEKNEFLHEPVKENVAKPEQQKPAD